jgi:hypothetical protein
MQANTCACRLSMAGTAQASVLVLLGLDSNHCHSRQHPLQPPASRVHIADAPCDGRSTYRTSTQFRNWTMARSECAWIATLAYSCSHRTLYSYNRRHKNVLCTHTHAHTQQSRTHTDEHTQTHTQTHRNKHTHTNTHANEHTHTATQSTPVASCL